MPNSWWSWKHLLLWKSCWAHTLALPSNCDFDLIMSPNIRCMLRLIGINKAESMPWYTQPRPWRSLPQSPNCAANCQGIFWFVVSKHDRWTERYPILANRLPRPTWAQSDGVYSKGRAALQNHTQFILDFTFSPVLINYTSVVSILAFQDSAPSKEITIRPCRLHHVSGTPSQLSLIHSSSSASSEQQPK